MPTFTFPFGKVFAQFLCMGLSVLSIVGLLFRPVGLSVFASALAILLLIGQVSVMPVIWIGHLFRPFTNRNNSTLTHQRFTSDTAADIANSVATFIGGSALWCVGMSPNAVRLHRLNSTSNVDNMGNRFQMFGAWIDAMTDAAHVIQLQVRWNWAVNQFPRKDMCEMRSSLETQSPVPIMIEDSSPKPARFRFLNLGIERLLNGLRFRHKESYHGTWPLPVTVLSGEVPIVQ